MRADPLNDFRLVYTPPADGSRLDDARPHGVIDTAPEPLFDELAAIAAEICGTSMAVVSLLDSERQWFKGRHGIALDELPLQASFCAHTISGGVLLEVPDARVDPRFATNPLVIGPPGVRFYAGAPLQDAAGRTFGSLCAFDTRPGRLDPRQRRALLRLATHAARQFGDRSEHLWQQARDIAFAQLMRALPAGVVGCGPDGRLQLLNPRARECLGDRIEGAPPEDWPHLLQVCDAAGRELALEDYPLSRALRGEPVQHCRLRIGLPDQPPRVLLCSAEPLPARDGAPAGALLVMQDVTGSHDAPPSGSEARLRALLRAVSDGVLATDAQGRITAMNRQAARLAWCPDWAARGQPLDALVRLVDDAGLPVSDPVARALEGGEQPANDGCLVLPDDRRVPVQYRAAPVRDEAGGLLGAILVLRDVSETRQLSRDIEYQATHDPLTALPNRRYLEAELARLLRETRSSGAMHSLLFVDLDQFKVINDTCGQAAGDALLQHVVALMREALRSSDLLARYGGDEFAVLLPEFPIDHAVHVAEALRAKLDGSRFVWEGRPFATSASIGVAALDPASTGADLVALAGSACYLAKEKGRNRIHVHRVGDLDLAQRRDELRWIPRIQQAIEDGRLLLYGQRIAPLGEDGDAGHIEVLVRMRDEAGALVPPMAFIPAAERYGLMQAIDRHVLDHALRMLAASHGGHVLAINLSGRSLGDDAFPDVVEAAFARHGVPFDRVGFEITETSAIANLAQARRFIDRFRDRGCRFSLDDFGSGMSSFGYLRDLGVDHLKIDGAFVRNLQHDAVDEAMVASIRNVAHVMGLKTIAEFVEDEATMAKLRAIGVDYAQGFGVHRPQPLEELLDVPALDGTLPFPFAQAAIQPERRA